MKKLHRCKGCLMADTKPGVVLNEKGLCQACVNRLNRREIDWNDRRDSFNRLYDYFSKSSIKWNVVVPSSGGKDSWFQVKKLKEVGFNPVCFRVSDPFTHTDTGEKNWKKMLEKYHVDGFTFELSPASVRDLTMKAFEDFGSPTWPIDRAIYALPLKFADKMGIKLICYGENVSYEYGGVQNEETIFAYDQIDNDVAKSVDLGDIVYGDTCLNHMYALKTPETDNISPFYLSYFFPWSGFWNYRTVSKDGFLSLMDTGEHRTWKRNGYIEPYDQIDSVGYLINVWMKWVKLGFGRATDVA